LATVCDVSFANSGDRATNDNRFTAVIHPVGNIAEHLVAAGLARVVDWHAGILASSGGMERLRAAEKAAKEKRLYLYANLPTSAASKTNEHSAGGSPRNFDGTVIRVWSGDQLSIVDKEGKERKVQLSSTRAPKCVIPLILYSYLSLIS
jgi:staphylococcal nuclease domain-containing protein 1